jgi:hypothetical protein
MSASDIIPWGQEFGTVGHLYRSIEAGLVQLSEKLGEEGLFIGPRQAQAGPHSFGWAELTPVTDLASARAGIQRIVEQGEGARGDWADAHYGRFVALLDEYLALSKADPTVEPAHPCLPAAVRPADGVEPERYITDPKTAAVTDLFNATYDLVLQLIVRFYAFGEESDEELGVLADVAVGLMFGAIRPVGQLLATMPIGDEYPGSNAGPAFQLAYRANFLIPHKRSAWIRFAERLDELAAFADGADVDGDARKVLDRTAAAMRDMLVRLGPYLEWN